MPFYRRMCCQSNTYKTVPSSAFLKTERLLEIQKEIPVLRNSPSRTRFSLQKISVKKLTTDNPLYYGIYKSDMDTNKFRKLNATYIFESARFNVAEKPAVLH